MESPQVITTANAVARAGRMNLRERFIVFMKLVGCCVPAVRVKTGRNVHQIIKDTAFLMFWSKGPIVVKGAKVNGKQKRKLVEYT